MSPALSIASQKWELINTARLLGYKYKCDQLIPGFKEKVTEGYRQWRKENSEIVDAIEQSPSYKRGKTNSNITLKDLKEIKKSCPDLADKFAEYTQEPDERLSSPQSTWDLYMTSLRDGDRKTALSCLSGVAHRNWKTVFKKISKKQMRKLFDSVDKFQLSHKISDEIVVGVAINKKGHAGEIFFTENRGVWRISQM